MNFEESHPSRVRGLKCPELQAAGDEVEVAPFTGAWIEMECPCSAPIQAARVAPFTGAWIEML